MSIFFIIYVVCLAIQAGLYFTFSNTIMPVLGKQPANISRQIMKDINQEIQNEVFLATLFSPFFLAIAMFLSGDLFTWQLVVSILLYTFGVFFVTVRYNLPLNRQLEDSTDRDIWESYQKEWVRWNHIRTIFAIIAIIFALI